MIWISFFSSLSISFQLNFLVASEQNEQSRSDLSDGSPTRILKSQKSAKFSINLRNEMFSDSLVVDKSRNRARSRGDRVEKNSQFDQKIDGTRESPELFYVRESGRIGRNL